MSRYLRVTFGKGEEIKYISHLDLTRAWARILHRAGIPLAYSQGFNPRPKISVAVPLPVGYTSCAEVLDVTLAEDMTAAEFLEAVKPHLPAGIEVFNVEELAKRGASLQSLVGWAEYTVGIKGVIDEATLREKIRAILATPALPRRKTRRGKEREYDLRAMIDDVWLIKGDDALREYTVGMRLRCGAQGAGRPEEVLAVMGIERQGHLIRRERLLMGGEIQVRRATVNLPKRGK